jgi:RNA polymerase sigma factor (sigma-70 family)
MSSAIPANSLNSLQNKIEGFDETAQPYSRLITENLSYIEKQCRKAVSRYGREFQRFDGAASRTWDISLENDADELLNELLDRLINDNFRALRAFRGTAKITTYLTTIISNLIVDIMRSKKGRSRAKERAREFGATGEHLYELVLGRGHSLHEAYEHLKVVYRFEGSLESLCIMLDRIVGRDFLLETGVGDISGVVTEYTEDDEPVRVIVDSSPSVEEEIVSRQRQSAAQKTIAEVLDGMSGEEQMMIRMRFPVDEDVPSQKVADIARKLNLSETVVDSRMRRILIRCREMLLGRGIQLDDLIEL